ncbi:hypothetical protein [Tsukamurella paurometabola]|uniref:Uncharacterized protein n=1 Tax=Tsukamurella paurometabola TaxID=2061 RepID=A0ABS5NKE9_TSUPA|nr:hypothetical protein [Tsukamurella paurometabola]MBS4104307.1 hypothetical protein [Tsukamurella paurometabola]
MSTIGPSTIHYPDAPFVLPLTVHLLRHLQDVGAATPAELSVLYGVKVKAAVEALHGQPWAIHKLTEQRMAVYTMAEAFADVTYSITDYGRDLLRWHDLGVNDGPHFQDGIE